MSTWCYYQCLDHQPPLVGDEEFTQHVGDRHWDRALALIAQRPVDLDERYLEAYSSLVGDEEITDAYFGGNARRFLNHHPTCRIGVIDEYGVTYPVDQEKSDA